MRVKPDVLVEELWPGAGKMRHSNKELVLCIRTGIVALQILANVPRVNLYASGVLMTG